MTDFRPFLGFSDVNRVYRSEGLFPLFAERIMDPRRPEHPMFLAALDLTGDVTPLEVVARSGGQRAGDGIMLLPVPEVSADGRTHCPFLVHGMRHTLGADERVGQLAPGDRLALLAEPDNVVNPQAVLVVEDAAQPLGYVPDALLDYIESVRDPRVTVVRVNGPEVGSRLRLLVRWTGGSSQGSHRSQVRSGTRSADSFTGSLGRLADRRRLLQPADPKSVACGGRNA